MISLENPTYLWGLLALLPLVYLFYRLIKWKGKVIKSLGDAKLVKKLIRSYSARNFRWKFYTVSGAFVLLVLAAAGLRNQTDQDTDRSAGVDIVIALDVSKSMLSQDIKPTRLDRAKQLIRSLTANLENNRIGLVVFAGQAILQMPLTDDIGAINMYIPSINTDMVPIQGTAIGTALLTANGALNAQDKKHKAIVLITDGETHDKTTDDAIKKLYADGVTVFTVGIGTPGGSPIFDPVTNTDKKDKDGNVVISKLNEATLKEIASKTNGSYVLLNNDRTAIESITQKIGTMEKKIIVSGKVGHRNFFYYFPYFIGFALLLLVLEIFIPERKRKLI